MELKELLGRRKKKCGRTLEKHLSCRLLLLCVVVRVGLRRRLVI